MRVRGRLSGIRGGRLIGTGAVAGGISGSSGEVAMEALKRWLTDPKKEAAARAPHVGDLVSIIIHACAVRGEEEKDDAE